MHKTLHMSLMAAALALCGCNHDLDSVALPCKADSECKIKGQRCHKLRCVFIDAGAVTDGPGVDSKAADGKAADGKAPDKKVATPDKKVATPDKKVATPDKKITAPDQKVTAPDQKVTPDQKVATPDQKVAPPDQKVTPPDQKVATPDQKVSAPDQKVTAPDQKVATPDQKVSAPDQKVTAPDQALPVPDMPSTATCSVKKLLSSKGDVGKYPSLHIRSNGDMHLACAREDGNGYVVYGSKPWGGTWYLSDFANPQSGAVGGLGLDVDAAGYMHIACQDLGSGFLRYLNNVKSGLDIKAEQKASPQWIGYHLAMGVNPAGRVAVSHYAQTAKELWLSTTFGSATSFGYGKIVANGQYSSLRVDASSGVHVSFVVGKDVKYHYNKTASTETIHSVNAMNDDTALVLDKSGVPHVAYRRSDGVYYAVRTGPGKWTTTQVDSTKAGGRNISLALDASGNAYLVYTDKAPGAGRVLLQSNKCNKSKWSKVALETNDSFDHGTAVAVHNDVVHLLYHNATKMDLVYATACVKCAP